MALVTTGSRLTGLTAVAEDFGPGRSGRTRSKSAQLSSCKLLEAYGSGLTSRTAWLRDRGVEMSAASVELAPSPPSPPGQGIPASESGRRLAPGQLIVPAVPCTEPPRDHPFYGTEQCWKVFVG